MKEPSEDQIKQRTSEMIGEINSISDDLLRSGKGETAFHVFTLRRLAWLEILVRDLVDSANRSNGKRTH